MVSVTVLSALLIGSAAIAQVMRGIRLHQYLRPVAVMIDAPCGAERTRLEGE